MSATLKQMITSWDEQGWRVNKSGSQSSQIVLGDAEDAPLMLMARFPPNAEVPPHTHDTDYCEVIIEGEQMIGRHLHKAGTVRVVKAGTGYGPIVCGDKGATVLFYFADHRLTKTIYLPRAKEAS